MKAINNTQDKPKNFYRLYHLIKQIPEYREIRDGAGKNRSNADMLIRGWIWQSTNEEKYLKHELTLSEYNRICSEIENKYNLKPAVHRNKSVKLPGEDEANAARRRLLRAVHANIELRGYANRKEYNDDRHGYAASMILRAAGGGYKTLNSIPSAKLQSLYSYYCNENKIFRQNNGSNGR